MVGEKLCQTNLLSRLSHKVCRLLSSPVLLRKFTNVFRTKVLIGETTFTSPALLETGPPFYVVIWATRGSRHLQGKGSTFISQFFFFKDPEPVPVRPRESNPRPRALQSSALPTDLILRILCIRGLVWHIPICFEQFQKLSWYFVKWLI